MPSHQAIEFWFEFASNYCYPAVMRVEALAAAHDVQVRWRPFLLGPVFKAMGHDSSPLFVHEAKARYVWRDMQRRCDRYGLPFQKPSVFPRRSLLPMRIATLGADEPWIGTFCREVMTMQFAHDQDIDDHAEMHRLLSRLSLPADDILEAAHTPDNKQRLRARTEEAGTRGIFGAPTMFVAGEMFWGDDRLDDAVEWAARR